MLRETLVFALYSCVIIIPLSVWMKKRNGNISKILLYSIFIVYIFGFIAQICLPINYRGTSILENIKNYPYNEYIYIILFKQKYFDINQGDALLRIIKSYILNIILTIPFGVLFPLIKPVKTKNIIWIAVMVGIIAETIQLSTGLIFGNQFRITHIDDVIMNAIGVIIGFLILKVIKNMEYMKYLKIDTKYQ
ncbi:VanZ family protein [Herpetosiphon gulosus]|uniref:VanZ-like domain-containing protein n=1 Tax=Herpetosiphon gulosus TaxID=1973496 RepID=A0ABP9X887_9CHLR